VIDSLRCRSLPHATQSTKECDEKFATILTLCSTCPTARCSTSHHRIAPTTHQHFFVLASFSQINLSHEAFDDLMVSASARLARLRAEKAAADAFANGLLVDCRAPLEAAAAACEELRNQGPLPESLELSATAAKARIVAMSVAQAKKRAEYEAALVAALEGEAWEPARDALAQATEGKTYFRDIS